MAARKKVETNIFVRMHPLQRMLASLAPAIILCILIRKKLDDPLLTAIATWATFAFFFTATGWIVLFTRTHEQIKELSKKEDGSRIFVLLLLIGTSLASMATVVLLVTGVKDHPQDEIITTAFSFFSVIISWLMVHMVMTFHYTHLYYSDSPTKKQTHREGLNFPEEEKPDYVDFAYFSYVVGMTFQVSDVQVTDKKFRRLVLAHGLLSFGLNTFVVALTINFLAGLSK